MSFVSFFLFQKTSGFDREPEILDDTLPPVEKLLGRAGMLLMMISFLPSVVFAPIGN